MLEPINEAELRPIPRFHMVCTSTLATRDGARLANARAEGRLREVSIGQRLMITEPEKPADALLQLTGA